MREELIDRGLLRRFRSGALQVHVYSSRSAMGAAAAGIVAEEIRESVRRDGRCAAIFASAPSQNEFLAELSRAPAVDWGRVTGFHLDEYLGIGENAPQSFRRFVIDRLVSRVPMGKFCGLQGESSDPEGECSRYAKLLESAKPAFAVLGIGENGHLAFIDPPYCNFHDPAQVKVVELDEVCRQQQVNDGAFLKLDDVPRKALSLTIPAIMRCAKLFAIVPGPAKRHAVLQAVEGPIRAMCPASILREHAGAHLFLDRESAALLANEVRRQ